MKFLRPLFYFLAPIVSLLVLAVPAAKAVGDDDWKPVDPAQLSMKTSVVEKDADAEALFWEVRMMDGSNGDTIRTVLDNYIRVKIFTDRGRESQSRIDIQYFPGSDVKEISARTIKPDGTIIELKKQDIYERTIVKLSGLKVKAKSFALPGVEAGSIIEYRWREFRGTPFYTRVQLQRDLPIQFLKYYIRPFGGSYFPYGMRVQTFNAQGSPFVKEKDGFYSMTMTNVPAFHEEPRMPPEEDVRSWMLVYYSEDTKLNPQEFWKGHAARVYERHKSSLKVNDDVRKKATELTADAAMPEQKLEKLFNFCRYEIKNVDDDASGLTREQLEKVKENKSPADTLKRGVGTWHDIDMLFAALANAAGFDARVSVVANRADIFFDPNFPDPYFMNTENIAVRVGNEWRFYDPASKYMSFGMLRWQEEGEQALISDPKELVWAKTPLSPPEKSLEKRTAKLHLDEEGTLEGDVRIEYTGHAAADKKEYNDDDSPAEREETLRGMVKARMETAEVSNIRIENVQDPIKPFVYEYHVRIPAYAQRTGKRLFLQPAFFQHGVSALFATSSRHNNIYFHYPWSEEDEVTIEFPAGFALDSPDSPPPFKAANISEYKVSMMSPKDQRMLIYKRAFFFGGNEAILFPSSGYGMLKDYFDRVYKADSHTITLKQGAATAPSSSN